ncbi:MAG: hypothetical protein MUD08_12360 [Cytophagales bacterium]|jgi:hypothetical protein|nr:hypothetical protein [Cytophagales bacterium]
MHDFDFKQPDFDWRRFIGRPYHRYLPDKKRMAYNKFSLEEALERLDLQKQTIKSVADGYKPQPPSELLKKQLRRGTARAIKMNTEKARSEFIVAPILLEIAEIRGEQISFFSGVDFRVDAKRGLSGRCDFLISLSSEADFLTAPAVTIVEAKNENVQNGLGQCVAEMVAAQIFNERRGQNIKTIYGAVTSGLNWLFLKLEGQTVYIEEIERVYDFERNLDELIGLLLRLTEAQN